MTFEKEKTKYNECKKYSSCFQMVDVTCCEHVGTYRKNSCMRKKAATSFSTAACHVCELFSNARQQYDDGNLT